MIKSFSDLMKQAQASGPKKVAVAVAQDEVVLEALSEAAKEKIATPILFGDKAAIEQAAQKAGVNIKGWEIHDIKDMAQASKAAVAAVSSGKADFLMKGLVATSTFLKAVLDKEVGLRTGRLLSHVAVMESSSYPKLILVSDGGMNVKPDLMAKVDIINNAVAIAHKLGVEKPKVAVLAAIEVLNPEMPDTIDASHLAKMADRGQIKGCLVDGPLALDLAVSAEAAAHKKIKSQVAGEADIFLTPEIASGNMLVKGLIYLGGAQAAGIIAGAAKPVVMLSRADSKQQKLNSIALGVVSC
ncbi:MAG: phosphate butyryltransferase [Candidatus Edwardsbacteria bacterium RIFOXYD12_FULL_50_11]|uniref:Phosphate butyryltransferase n=1 Tax=Candidatus Edwardsbacteria bacterium GWF2_54_11 TaxID=1817851 RepID=A0A1F5RI91_9BACT|nr:MAG: phosphate butyryltransferase [Candidatus Edwardsbacteria bacterium RifOxyC12_full_54_24]OGF06164.1 MAG: phosphate butyryltransferase [Candidatus Edwardsbacteria bacterium RifOxyA12_full_54_48]OGF12569.1 MAG: phosphate butyryltransferase [Candidatus Edwardsbacteria bacterium GWE2_54_12]OGF13893.1 MAG: phosphate butyryltransferase [Candidatus Edwardsbacteria bacterium GWF2_54_11]OGF17592.1 MAG: phosphate butyryltransferase [Candidatus Edwardsbacteria bacterium RIFOXYD12_FULL_50_11]OGJ189